MQEQLELLTPGRLVVATEGNFPPYSMIDKDGNLDGIEIRLMREIAHRIGLEYCPVVVDWRDIVCGINDNRYDISSASMDITPERIQYIDFSRAWLESGAQLLVRAHDCPIWRGDLTGRCVGMIIDSTWELLAYELNADNVVTFSSNPEALEALISGEVDAVITDAIVSTYVINHLHLPLKQVSTFLKPSQKGWAIKKGKTNLLNAINGVLGELLADNTYDLLTSSLLGYAPRFEAHA